VSAAQRPALRVTTPEVGPTTVVHLAGDLDLATAGQLRGCLRDVLDRGRVQRVVLDLAGLEFLDVTGLNVIVDAQQLLAQHDGVLALRSPRPMVLRMLKLLGLDNAVRVED
jgi:anti-anti-sigma factor